MPVARGNHRLPSSDESWPYPDLEGEPATDEEVDLDLLELRVDPRAYSGLTPGEREVLFLRFGLRDGVARSMKEISHSLDLTHAETRDVLGRAIDKVRHRLVGMDGRL
jgi:DNA-directed RNA polymerase sigma subunit (sigma70/sigma32)